MAKDTNIEWCDSTVNAEIGCDGCELWTKDGKVRTCYAGILVGRYAGHSTGYPASFDKPQLYLKRLLDAERWKSLTGTDREEKPWLNKLPRCIFLNDLGDTFTASLPRNWLITPADELGGRTPLGVLAGMDAIIMMLTKRPEMMYQLFEQVPCPDNFIPMTSITGPQTLNRLRYLTKIKARWHGVSVEPLLKGTTLGPYLEKLSWVIPGGESGSKRRPYDLLAFRELRDECARIGIPFFMKQLDKVTPIPAELDIRQMPAFTVKREICNRAAV